jgi:hypothetical protein
MRQLSRQIRHDLAMMFVGAVIMFLIIALVVH